MHASLSCPRSPLFNFVPRVGNHVCHRLRPYEQCFPLTVPILRLFVCRLTAIIRNRSSVCVCICIHLRNDPQVLYIVLLTAASALNIVNMLSTITALVGRHIFTPEGKWSPMSFMKLTHEVKRQMSKMKHFLRARRLLLPLDHPLLHSSTRACSRSQAAVTPRLLRNTRSCVLIARAVNILPWLKLADGLICLICEKTSHPNRQGSCAPLSRMHVLLSTLSRFVLYSRPSLVCLNCPSSRRFSRYLYRRSAKPFRSWRS